MVKSGFPSATEARKIHKPTYGAILDHFKNKRRAHITAARNGKERKFEDRMLSAMLASAANRMLTGCGFVVTANALYHGNGFSEDTEGLLSPLDINRYIQNELNRLVFFKCQNTKQTNLAYDNRVHAIQLQHSEERMAGKCQRYYSEYEMLIQYMFELDFRRMVFLLPAEELTNLRAQHERQIKENVTKELVRLPIDEFERQRQCVLRGLHPEHDQEPFRTVFPELNIPNSNKEASNSAISRSVKFINKLLGPAAALCDRVLENLYMNRSNADRDIMNKYLSKMPQRYGSISTVDAAVDAEKEAQLNKCTDEPAPVIQRIFDLTLHPYESALAPFEGQQASVFVSDPVPIAAPVAAPVAAATAQIANAAAVDPRRASDPTPIHAPSSSPDSSQAPALALPSASTPDFAPVQPTPVQPAPVQPAPVQPDPIQPAPAEPELIPPELTSSLIAQIDEYDFRPLMSYVYPSISFPPSEAQMDQTQIDQIGSSQNQLNQTGLNQVDQPQLNQPQLYQPQLDQPQLDQTSLDQPQLDLSQFDMPQLDLSQFDMSLLDLPQPDQTQLDQASSNQPQLNQTGLDQAGLNQAQFDQIGFAQNQSNQFQFDQASLNQTQFDQTGLNQAQFEAGMASFDSLATGPKMFGSVTSSLDQSALVQPELPQNAPVSAFPLHISPGLPQSNQGPAQQQNNSGLAQQQYNQGSPQQQYSQSLAQQQYSQGLAQQQYSSGIALPQYNSNMLGQCFSGMGQDCFLPMAQDMPFQVQQIQPSFNMASQNFGSMQGNGMRSTQSSQSSRSMRPNQIPQSFTPWNSQF